MFNLFYRHASTVLNVVQLKNNSLKLQVFTHNVVYQLFKLLIIVTDQRLYPWPCNLLIIHLHFVLKQLFWKIYYQSWQSVFLRIISPSSSTRMIQVDSKITITLLRHTVFSVNIWENLVLIQYKHWKQRMMINWLRISLFLVFKWLIQDLHWALLSLSASTCSDRQLITRCFTPRKGNMSVCLCIRSSRSCLHASISLFLERK